MGKGSGKRLSEKERALIGAEARNPHNVSQLAKKFTSTRPVIRRWLKEGLQDHPDYSEAPRRGKESQITPALKAAVRKKGRKGLTAEKISKDLASSDQPVSSPSTVRRILKSGKQPLSYLPIHRGKQLSEKNRKERLDFCRQHLHSQFKTWVFSDAKDLYMYVDELGNLHHAWQEPNTPWASLRRPWHFRFYAAVAQGHKSKLYFVPPSPEAGTKQRHAGKEHTAETYIEVLKQLEEELGVWYPDRKRYALVQDNAPQHTARATKKNISTSSINVLDGWPPQSWDLNIIENVWGVLSNKLESAKATDSAGWRASIERAWGDIELSTINKLVGGVQSRMEKIIVADGQWVPHH